MRKLYFASAVILLSMTAAAYAVPADTAQPATRIETDQKSGTIRFIVKGQEEARIDAAGLHVRNSIDYDGSITDGSSVYSVDPARPDQTQGRRQ